SKGGKHQQGYEDRFNDASVYIDQFFHDSKDRKYTLCFLFLLFGSGKQYIVKNKPVTGRCGMQFKFGFRVPYPMLIIFGVMTTVKSEKSLAFDSVDIAGLPIKFIFSKDQNR